MSIFQCFNALGNALDNTTQERKFAKNPYNEDFSKSGLLEFRARLSSELQYLRNEENSNNFFLNERQLERKLYCQETLEILNQVLDKRFPKKIA